MQRTAGHLAAVLAVALLLVISWASPRPLAGQEVHGQVTAVDGTPLVGGYVALSRGGEVVVSGITGDDGRFRLPVLEPGLYTLEAEYLGYGSAITEVEAGPAELAPVILTLSRRAIQLEGLVAEAEQECDIPPELGARVVELWDEVSKVFQVAVVAESRELYHFEAERWTRTLDLERLQVQGEQRESRSGLQRGSPFVSLPAENLAENGYIRQDSTGRNVYLAPDARVLLSDAFQATHCFGVTLTPPEDGERDWVGIQFTPRDLDARDIEGTLWIESDGYGPRRLDYRYRNLPWDFRSDQVGGRLSFDRLPDGPWIVRAWRIRMPKVSQAHYRLTRQLSAQQRWFMDGITEVGGEVVRALGPGGVMVRFGNPGRITGVVEERGGEGVGQGRVELTGTHFRARTDQVGNFELQEVPAGRYRLRWSSAILDSLGLPPREGVVGVEPGETTRRTLPVPSLADAVVEACQAAPEGAVGEGSAILRGIARTSGGAAPDSAEVRVTWMGEVDLEGLADGLGIQEGRAGVLAPVGEDGRWVACGVPDGVTVTVEARWADARDTPGSIPVEVLLDADELRGVAALTLPPRAAVATAFELEGLGVAVEGAIRELRDIGVRRAELGQRFIDFEDLRNSRFGARSVMELLQAQNLPGVRVREQPDGTTCIFSQRYRSVDMAGGLAMGRCAAVYVDGHLVDPKEAAMIPPQSVAAMAYLRAFEALARVGSGSEGGALFIWTDQGGVRDPEG